MIPESYRWVPPAVSAGLPFNVAQMFKRMAEGIRERKPVSPDFDVAVKRHQLLDAIQKASDTGCARISLLVSGPCHHPTVIDSTEKRAYLTLLVNRRLTGVLARNRRFA